MYNTYPKHEEDFLHLHSLALTLCNAKLRKSARAPLEYTPSDIPSVDSRSIPLLLAAYLASFPQLWFVTEKQPELPLNN